MATRSNIRDNLKRVRERMASAAARARRSEGCAQLVVVTKDQPIAAVCNAIDLGEIELGESRVQDLQERIASVGEFLARRSEGVHPGIHWHMIGHLQRNKVKTLLPVVHAVHSVDTLRLAETIDQQAARLNRVVPVLMEVNCSGEKQKNGVPVGAAECLAEQISTLRHVDLLGTMTMAPRVEDAEEARPTFVRMREIFEDIARSGRVGPGFRHLSMGMSQDFEVAIEEGATIVRVGSAIFA
ncbi:MAG: Pyridoxal phosphate homeostasis protein [Phycisphaerae bacterium]|nr:Pyridoxal phosphate homeostasis protein [Phycisphaerae bacterium]